MAQLWYHRQKNHKAHKFYCSENVSVLQLHSIHTLWKTMTQIYNKCQGLSRQCGKATTVSMNIFYCWDCL